MTFNNKWLLVNGAVLHQQMGLRGITAGQLSEASGVTAETLSRIRRGYIRVRPSTMEKIAKGLKKFPVIEGIEPMLVTPQAENKMVEAASGVGDQPPVVPVRKRRRKLRQLWPTEGIPPEFVNGLRVIEEKPRASESIAASAPEGHARRPSGAPHKPATAPSP